MKIGMHYIADLAMCGYIPTLLELEAMMGIAVAQARMTPLSEAVGTVVGGDTAGDSKIILHIPLAESHFSVHVFEALKIVAVDFFTCNLDAPSADVFYGFCAAFEPDLSRSIYTELSREVLDIPV